MTQQMRVAILHDYLNQYGGAERVLEALLEVYPSAHIYTLLYDAERTRGAFASNITKTSFLDLKFIRNNHRLFIPFMPFAARMLKSDERYDLVISSSAGYGKGINVRGKYHVSYCHTPLRYAWELDHYLRGIPLMPWPVKELIARPIGRALQRWDYKTSLGVNVFIANSEHIREKIRVYYKRDALVVYPPVDTKTFYPDRGEERGDPYYLMVGRLLYYKRFDLGVTAFSTMKRRLIVVGRGPEYARLRALADPRYVTFVSSPTDQELRRIYSNASGLIFPQVEDFGLVAGEATACGTPVLAYGEGGGAEIVIPGKTGILFHEQSVKAIESAVREAEKTLWNRKVITDRTKRFSKEAFKEGLANVLRSAGVGA